VKAKKLYDNNTYLRVDVDQINDNIHYIYITQLLRKQNKYMNGRKDH